MTACGPPSSRHPSAWKTRRRSPPPVEGLEADAHGRYSWADTKRGPACPDYNTRQRGILSVHWPPATSRGGSDGLVAAALSTDGLDAPPVRGQFAAQLLDVNVHRPFADQVADSL